MDEPKPLGIGPMSGENLKPQRNPSWSGTLLRVVLICGGSVAILLPAWLPNRPSVPIERGTVELLQAFLLVAAAAVILGASTHAGRNRPVCRVLAMGLCAAFVGEIDDFISGIMRINFPEGWAVGFILLFALVTMGNHAGSGLIGSALLIIYVFNRVIGSTRFWKATLGDAFSPEVPRICKSYLELLAFYLIFIGILGLSITLARRKEL